MPKKIKWGPKKNTMIISTYNIQSYQLVYNNLSKKH